MIAVTLNDVLIQSNETNLLRLKRKLIDYKRSGYLFIKESIASLDLDQPFELYYALSSGAIPYRNAFPIPSDCLLYSCHSFNQFYLKYYKEDMPLEFRQSHFLFKGEHFVWVYQPC